MYIPVKTHNNSRVLITTVSSGLTDKWTTQYDDYSHLNARQCPECTTELTSTAPCLQIQVATSRNDGNHLLTAQFCVNDIQSFMNTLRSHNPQSKLDSLNQWCVYIADEPRGTVRCAWCNSGIDSKPFYALVVNGMGVHEDCVPPFLDAVRDAYNQLAETHADIALKHLL